MSLDDLKTAQALIAKHIAEIETPKFLYRTDRKVEGPSVLPIADMMTDPIFGTKIKRVTTTAGALNERSYRTMSSGYGWSADSKHLAVIRGDGSIWLIDRKFAKQQLTGFQTEIYFSRENPNLVYGGNYLPGDIGVVNQYDISNNQYKQVLKLRDLVPTLDSNGRTYMRGINSANGKLTVLFGGTGQDSDHYVYICDVDGNNGKLFDSRLRLKCNLHAIGLDLTGRYVILGPTVVDMNGPNKLAANIVWDTDKDTLTPMTVSAGGHGALGFGVSVNNPDDADGMQYLIRSLTTPNTVQEIIKPYPTPPAFKMASHMSWYTSHNDLVTATYRYNEGIKAQRREWDDEILEVHLDGTVERICQHHSIVTPPDMLNVIDYWATPKPCVAPNGDIIFTSNWDRTLGLDNEGYRQDVFLVERS